MNNNKKIKSVNNSKCLIISGIKAAAIGFAAMLGFYLFSALICLKSDSFNLKFSIVSYIIFALASFLSGSITAFCRCDKKIFACFVSVFIFLVFTFIMLTVISGFSLQIKSLLIIPICVVFSSTGCILFKNRKKRH